jgi:cell division septation protein DedD
VTTEAELMTEVEAPDTEITLGTGRLLGLFFGLVIVCALFFGLGFSMGKNAQKSNLTMEEAPATTMQAQANAVPKSAGGQAVKPEKAPDCLTPGGCTDAQGATDASQAAAPAVTSAASTAPAGTPAPEMSKGAPLTPNSGAFTVQIAAVSKEEDAEALVSALRKKSYPVFIAPNTADKLFHVQIGPFADMKDAEAMKARLTGDGYNPIVKK